MSITIAVPEGDDAGAVWGAERLLPSGKGVRFRRGTGKDVRLALAAVGQPFDGTRYLSALIARTARIEGRTITMEGMDALDAEDAEALLEAVRKPRPSRPAPAALAESPAEG